MFLNVFRVHSRQTDRCKLTETNGELQNPHRQHLYVMLKLFQKPSHYDISAMDTDKIKIFGARVKVDGTGKLAELERAERVRYASDPTFVPTNSIQRKK